MLSAVVESLDELGELESLEDEFFSEEEPEFAVAAQRSFLLCGGRWFLSTKCFLQVALWGEVI